MSNTKFAVWSPKGGAGTTVTTAGLAVLLANEGIETLAVGEADLQRALGLPPFSENEDSFVPAGERLNFSFSTSPLDTPGLVIDAGCDPRDWTESIPDIRPVLVMRLCYLTIQAVLDYGQLPENTVIVNISEPGRALRLSDVEAVFHDRVSYIIDLPHDPAIARSIDAGLIIHRCPKGLDQLKRLFEEDNNDQ